MIDIHSHILPCLDDGADSQEQFLAMAQIAVDDGITQIIATPHHMNGIYTNSKQNVIDMVVWANKLLHTRGIPLTIRPGQEVYVYKDLVEDIRNNRLLFLDHHQAYILLELPHSIPLYIVNLIYDLRVLGVTPIIPHPERYNELRAYPNYIYDMVKSGALIQITAASLIGQFGKTVMKFCHQLIKHNLVQLIGSDAHNTSNRSPNLSKAFYKLAHIGGRAFAAEVKQNAVKVWNGEYITAEEPLRMNGKFFKA